jgi:hypothetical protein
LPVVIRPKHAVPVCCSVVKKTGAGHERATGGALPRTPRGFALRPAPFPSIQRINGKGQLEMTDVLARFRPGYTITPLTSATPHRRLQLRLGFTFLNDLDRGPLEWALKIDSGNLDARRAPCVSPMTRAAQRHGAG